jgi:hypothetical protein
MDPVMLASAVIAVIRPLLGKFVDAATSKAADAAADATGSGAVALYRAIRKRMARDGYHEAILQGAEDQPDNEDRIDTLSGTLTSILKADTKFASVIADLVGQTSQSFIVTNSGAVAGRDINITATNAAGRDLIIGETGRS